ncbi:MAG: hypothetical protein Q8O67_33290 [Deltaproteobacteria bacterium]|nr:hypothetical protein [Deltaproteobacteria bacterium]
MTNRPAPAALLTTTTPCRPLARPLLCWHESRHSARTDLVVSLSMSQAFIATDRPLPPGTPVYLDLDIDNGGAAIDAVASDLQAEGSAGFGVDFVTVDERALSFLELVLAAFDDKANPAFPAIEPLSAGRMDTPTVPAGPGVGRRLPAVTDVDDRLPVTVEPVEQAPAITAAPAVERTAPFVIEEPPPVATPEPAAAIAEPAATMIVEPELIEVEPIEEEEAPIAATAVEHPIAIQSAVTPSNTQAPPTSTPAPAVEVPWEAPAQAPTIGDRTRTEELFAAQGAPSTSERPPPPPLPPAEPVARTRTAPLGLPAFGSPGAELSDLPTTPAFAKPAFAEPAPEPTPEPAPEPAIVAAPAIVPPATDPRLAEPTPHPPTLELIPAVAQPWSRSLAANLPMDESSDVENTQRWPTARVRSDAADVVISLPGFAPPPEPPGLSAGFAVGPHTPAPSLPSRMPTPVSGLPAPAPLPLHDETAPWPTARVKTDSFAAATSVPSIRTPDSTAPWPAARVAEGPATTTIDAAAAPAEPSPPAAARDASFDGPSSSGFEITFDSVIVKADPALIAAVASSPVVDAVAVEPPVVVAAPTAAPAGPPPAEVSETFEVEFTGPHSPAPKNLFASVPDMPPDAGTTTTTTTTAAAAPAAGPRVRPLPAPDDDAEDGEVVDVDFSEFNDVIGVRVTFRSEGPPPAPAPPGLTPLGTSTVRAPVRPPPGVVDAPAVDSTTAPRVPTPPSARPPPLVRASVLHENPVQLAVAMSPPLGGGADSPSTSANPFAGESQPPMQSATVPPMFSAHDPDKWQVGPRLSTPPSSLPTPRLLDAGFSSILTSSGSGSNSPTPMPLSFVGNSLPGTAAPMPAPAPAPAPTTTTAPAAPASDWTVGPTPALPSLSPITGLTRPPSLATLAPAAPALEPVAVVVPAVLPRPPSLAPAPAPAPTLPPTLAPLNDDLDDLPVIMGGGDDDDLPVVTGAATGVPTPADGAGEWNFGPPTSPGRPRKP